MNFFKLYIGDYQRDTALLSIAEHGAYLLMLQHYYATEQPLPTGKTLYRMLRAQDKEEQDAIDSVVAKFWEASEGGLVNRRAMEELEKGDRQREKNRELGKLGGRPKKTQRGTDSVSGKKPNGNPDGNRMGSDSDIEENRMGSDSVSEMKPNGNPNQTPDTREAKAKAPQAAVLDFRADLFRRWKELPDGGGGAFLSKLFREHKPEERVVEAVERTLDQGRADPKAFVVGVLRKAAADDAADDDMWARVK